MEIFLLLVSLAITVLIVAACYSEAESKGHSGILAAVLGFFFGLIVWVIYKFVVQERTSWSPEGSSSFGPVARNAPPPVQRACWSCGAAVGAQASVCQGCGSRLNF